MHVCEATLESAEASPASRTPAGTYASIVPEGVRIDAMVKFQEDDWSLQTCFSQLTKTPTNRNLEEQI